MKTLHRASLLLLLFAFTPVHAQPPISVDDAWVRAAPPNARVLAGYMTIKNTTRRVISLTGVSSPQFESVEIHRSFVVDGVARMEAVERIPVQGMREVSLEPGGLHLMLIGPKDPVSEGDSVDLELSFDNGWSLELTVPVRRSAPDSHHQHH